MRSRVIAALAGLAAAISLAGSAQAQIVLQPPGGGGGGDSGQQSGAMLSSISAPQLISLLGQAGFQKGQLVKEQDNFKIVRFELGGTVLPVALVGCQGNACSGFTIFLFFPKQQLTLPFLNAFNAATAFSRLYVNDEGSPVLRLDANVSSGVSANYVTQMGGAFGASIKQLLEFRPG